MKMHLGKSAKNEIEQAMALDPRSLDAMEGLMSYYLEAPGIMGGSVSKAEEMAGRILAADAVRGNLASAEIALHEKQYDKAEAAYLKAVAAGPKSYDALAGTAALYLGDPWKDHDKAAEYASKAIEADGSRAAGYVVLAQALVHRERWSELDALLAKAEKAVPDDFSPDYVAGRALLVSGKDPVRAERYFRKYLTQEPEGETPPLAGAHWRLGQALERQGKKQEAIEEMETAVRQKPDLKEAQQDLKRLRR